MQNLPAQLGDKLEALQSCRYFSSFPEKVLHFIAQGMSLRMYARGEVLFWEDEPCAGLHMIQEGMVKLFKISPQGREFILNIKENGEIFNEVPVFDYGTNPVNVSALQDTTVWVVSPQIIQEAMERYPEILQPLVVRMCEQLRNLVKMLEELSFYQVTHRLARLIRELSPDQLTGTAGERLTQDDLAARLGTVREVVARALRQLERSGAISAERGRIRILDREILEEWGQNPEG